MRQFSCDLFRFLPERLSRLGAIGAFKGDDLFLTVVEDHKRVAVDDADYRNRAVPIGTSQRLWLPI